MKRLLIALMLVTNCVFAQQYFETDKFYVITGNETEVELDSMLKPKNAVYSYTSFLFNRSMDTIKVKKSSPMSRAMGNDTIRIDYVVDSTVMHSTGIIYFTHPTNATERKVVIEPIFGNRSWVSVWVPESVTFIYEIINEGRRN